MKVQCSPEYCYANDQQGNWVPCDRHALGFSAGTTGSSSSAVQLIFRRAFILPRAFCLLQSSATTDLPVVSQCDLAIKPNDRRAPPLGSTSLIAASTSGVHHPAGNPDPTVMFRPRRFSRPRRFAPPPAFAGLFHPAATSRVCPTGDCPSPRSRTGFPPPSHALVSLNAPACGLTRASLCALAFRALLPALSAVSIVAV